MPLNSTRAAAWPRLRLSIAAILMAGFGGLVLLAVASVLSIGLGIARENTFQLLRERMDSAIADMVARTNQHLKPAHDQVSYLSQMVTDGRLDPAGDRQLREVLRAAMAGTPQVRGLAYIDTAFNVYRVARSGVMGDGEVVDWANDPAVRESMGEARSAIGVYWGDLFWSQRAGETLINLRAPLRRDGAFLGVLIATVAISDLSRTIAEIVATPGQTGFILYGGDRVLAHPNMRTSHKRPQRQPLPGLGDVDDPMLAAIWDTRRSRDIVFGLSHDTDGHAVLVDGERHIFLYRQVEDYGDIPWLIGIHMAPETTGQALIQRLMWAGAAGGAILALALFAALMLGRKLSVPIRDLAVTAHHVANFELASIAPLDHSMVRELDDAAEAVNRMIGGLRWFANYVPRPLVRFLIAEGGGEEIDSEERELTVMFTDIAGFTGLAQTRTAAQSAALLNAHFALVASQIEAEQGTLDKYMGDSVMAFWGAPALQADHAARACRAARALRDAIVADNEARAAQGEVPLRVRIGIHTGPAIVGNIGAPGRVNYTLVGDTVNIAQRLQEAGKLLPDGRDQVVVLISETTARRLDGSIALTPLGGQDLRGWKGQIGVFRIT